MLLAPLPRERDWGEVFKQGALALNEVKWGVLSEGEGRRWVHVTIKKEQN
jgi:hypothetical protein